MKLNLVIGERLALAQILPKEGNFLTLRIIKKITEKVSLTETEIEDWQIKSFESSPGTTSFSWSPAVKTDTEIEFTDAETDLIRQELNKLDKSGKLTFGNISTFEKFCA